MKTTGGAAAGVGGNSGTGGIREGGKTEMTGGAGATGVRIIGGPGGAAFDSVPVIFKGAIGSTVGVGGAKKVVGGVEIVGGFTKIGVTAGGAAGVGGAKLGGGAKKVLGGERVRPPPMKELLGETPVLIKFAVLVLTKPGVPPEGAILIGVPPVDILKSAAIYFTTFAIVNPKMSEETAAETVVTHDAGAGVVACSFSRRARSSSHVAEMQAIRAARSGEANTHPPSSTCTGGAFGQVSYSPTLYGPASLTAKSRPPSA